jgi:serine/threonine protein kinase
MTPEAKRDFSDELERLKLMRHRGLVRCFGGGFDAKDAYLVYELIDGESLVQLLGRRERLAWETVLDYGLQLCEALQSVHEAGWVHGRIRPDKLLITRDSETIKILDLRSSRAFEGPLTADQIPYCAPEVFSAKPMRSVAGDLYSVGAVLYQMLTGLPPFTGPNPTIARQAVLEAALPPVASIVFDCPVWLSAIVEQMLHRDPVKRPYTAAAAAIALREAQKRANEGGSVAQHAVSGFSPLQMNTNRAEAEKALGIKKKKKRRRDDEEIDDRPNLWERPSVLSVALLALVAVITYLVWPLSESQLKVRAESLMSRDDAIIWNDARDKYLYQMLERFPEGRHADWAQEQLDLIEMRNAEDRMRRNMRVGREPTSEGERKFAEANRFERFGDRVTALDKYKGIVKLLKDESKERPFVNLAKRQIAQLESNPPSIEELRRFLQEKLVEADTMYKDGDVLGARQIWEGIVSLYNGNQEMISFVEQAQTRLDKYKSS